MRAARLAIAFALAPVAAAAQISPGELSRFHQALEGARQCASCHEPGRGVSATRCLNCHRALAERIAAGRGLHARADHRACERCHVEHQGRGFDLVFWGEAGRGAFDHAKTGFVLRGAHASAACESCHRPGHIGNRDALARGGANLARTFLGLSPACASCHGDPHRGQFAPRGCPDCHGETSWALAGAFDHARTGFALTGGHARAACSECHRKRADGAVTFQGTPRACASCHRDPHAGRLGSDCASCHGPEGWARVARGRFDHSRTRFPLTGRHRAVECASCHAPRGGAMRFAGTAFATCASCHRDPHAGRLGAQCASCHDTAGWARVAAGRFDHDHTRFPLRGRHRTVPCATCHDRRGLTMAHARCTDCHADRHAGQLARRADGGRCETCHDVEGWAAVRFTADDHARTAWALTGAHLAVPCDGCHREVPIEAIRALGFARAAPVPARTEKLRFASTACRECHRDPHAGQFARAGRTDCPRCHVTASWVPAGFDHDRETRFPLVGAHRAVPCAGCHRRHSGQGTVVRYSGLGTACTDCHGAQGTTPRGEGR